MNKNTSDDSGDEKDINDSPEAKHMFKRIKEECNKGVKPMSTTPLASTTTPPASTTTPPTTSTPPTSPSASTITKPWSTDSNLLYIAAVIDINSDVGKEIEYRTNATGNKAYSKYGSGKLHCPHISILQIFVKELTRFDFWIKTNLKNISDKIVELYKNMFINQIHSEYDHYDNLGGWCVRNYDDDDNPKKMLSNAKNIQTNFRNRVNNYLLTTYTRSPSNTYSKIIQEQPNIPPYSPSSSVQTFIHFSIRPAKDSIMAEGTFFTDKWAPHVSLLKTTNINYQEDFKSKASSVRNMSWISLWGSKQNINIDGKSRKGTISYIFVSYAGDNYWIAI
jgi:hypothetical protein